MGKESVEELETSLVVGHKELSTRVGLLNCPHRAAGIAMVIAPELIENFPGIDKGPAPWTPGELLLSSTRESSGADVSATQIVKVGEPCCCPRASASLL